MGEVSFIPVQTVEAAISIWKRYPPGEAVFMAGGTDLLVRQRQKLLTFRILLYLKSIRLLANIEPDENGGWTIGAMVTLDDLAHHPDIRERYPMLAQGVASVASPQIRHKATLGGNICLDSRCWFYNRSPFWRAEYPQCRKASGGGRCYVLPKSKKGCFALQSGDSVGPLVALAARLKLVSEKGERVVPIEDFFLGDGINYLDLRPDEILTHVLLPPPRAQGVFMKFRPQNNLDFATFTLSVIPPWEGKGARIVVGSVASKPLRARGAEALWDQGEEDGKRIASKAVEELRMVSFVRGSVAFKKRVMEAKLEEMLRSLISSRRYS